MAIRERTITFAGDAIAAGGAVKTGNNIRERADPVGAGFHIPWTAHFLDPAWGVTRWPNGKQRGVVETLGIKTRLYKGTFVGKCEGVGGISDVHKLVDKRITGAFLGPQIRILGVVHPGIVVCDTRRDVVVEVAVIVAGLR